MTEIVAVTGKCVKCARRGNVQGASDTVRWQLCDIPSPAIELPIREFELVSGKMETRIVGYEQRPGDRLFYAHLDYSCDQYLAAAKPRRAA